MAVPVMKAQKDHESRLRRLLVALVAALVVLAAEGLATAPQALAACANPVACENALPGDPQSDWAVQGIGDESIQGYATSMSVNVGQTESFKIKTPSTNYHIDILRLGYYGGDGARKVAANIKPTAKLPQTQPACQTFSDTGLIDCGNWSVSASWTVPSNAVSGVYIAHLVRDDSQDPGGDSQIPFVVRNDASHSDMVVATSDATWEAYNAYGGNSLYSCSVACPSGNPLAYKAAYAVSYNRPFDGAFGTDGGASYLWYAEYQMIRFLEENGYDVSYVADSDLDRTASVLLNHKLFISSGHDEYWSGNERANVQAALNAGVNLAFFTGNEMFWKTRWTASSDGSNTPYRTLITYKETHFSSPVDPQDPPIWTGVWGDPRWNPPGDGGVPANALTGQEFIVNSGTADITVPSQYSKMRLWRNTAVASLSPGASVTLGRGTGTLGYEWDIDADNGYRPAGLFDLSSTTVSGVQPITDFGSTTGTGTETHHLTLYKAPSGALVFGAGTVQWSWGLDNDNAWGADATDPSDNPPDRNMQQTTANLFADMGIQPTTLISGLVSATASTDTTPPTSSIASPVPNANLQSGNQITLSGSATDVGGVVAGVEVSTDGGSTWHPANIAGADAASVSWTYTWNATGAPSTTIATRAVDDSGNIEHPSDAISVNVSCPCSIWGNSMSPAIVDTGDTSSVTVGVKFQSSQYGSITGIRFYKASTNTGAHIGSLWSSTGQLLASATFTSETASGWQTVTFAQPVTIQPNTTYVASYLAPTGHESATGSYFYPYGPSLAGGADYDSPPLHAVPNNSSVNGLYTYGPTNTFPTSTYQAANYWVDAVFTPIPPPGQVTNVSGTAGYDAATINWSAPSSGGTVTTYTVTPYIGSQAQAPTTVQAPATGVTLDNLQQGTAYTFTVQASNPNGAGPPSSASNQVTPTGPSAPAAPTAVTASPASGQALVSWTAPNTNGSPITSYTITPYAGGSPQTPVQVLNGSATSATVTGLATGTSYMFTVSATNGLGTGPASAASSAVVPADTVFDFATPSVLDSGDSASATLGVKFTADTSGQVLGIRFYKASANTGTHIGSLWTASGQQLASATFTTETGSAWQTVLFSSPVSISPGTTYIASYFAPNGRYSFTSSQFTSAVDNPPLHAVANSSSGDGVYSYGSANSFPATSYQASNYWVDVLFQPTPPGQVTGVTATAGHLSANVSWTPPAGGGVTSYTITPYIGGAAQPSTTISGNPPASSATIANLQQGASYTFKVQASNAQGSGPLSTASNSVTPTAPTAPDAPTSVSALPASGQALVTWTSPAANGSPISSYTVTPYIGANPQPPVQVNTGSANSTTVSNLTTGTAYTFRVTATNGIGTSPSSAPSPAATPEDTIFDFSAPTTVDSGDTTPANLGVKFSTDTTGQIVGIRFYKAVANAGTHIGSLWTTTGQQLASATFTNESPSGWQTVTFAQPVTISPGTTYVASYFVPNGHYSYTGSQFASAVDNAPLHAVGNNTSPNGVYDTNSVSDFPTSSFKASNYWVDALFQPTPPGQVTNVTASAGRQSANVTWSAPAGGGATTYTITPYIGGTAQTQIVINGNPPATSATVTGLQAGTAYTFKVQASNSNGSSPLSGPSNSVTPTAPTSPGPPIGVAAIPATGQAMVSWIAPSDDGGSAISSYTITPFIGTTAQSPVQVNDGSAASATVTGLANGTAYTFKVSATNGVGTGSASSASSAITPQDTIFDFTKPATVDSGDSGSANLGVKFTADSSGQVLGIRFYKAAANTGTHVGNLWSAGGQLLATATYANETASGWQTVLFSAPVSISAGTAYVASYFAPHGRYSYTAGGLATAFDNPPLHALANGTSVNGLYDYSSLSDFPTNSFNATNYWVDVLFVPAS